MRIRRQDITMRTSCLVAKPRRQTSITPYRLSFGVSSHLIRPAVVSDAHGAGAACSMSEFRNRLNYSTRSLAAQESAATFCRYVSRSKFLSSGSVITKRNPNQHIELRAFQSNIPSPPEVVDCGEFFFFHSSLAFCIKSSLCFHSAWACAAWFWAVIER